jgi:hypothetical protein
MGSNPDQDKDINVFLCCAVVFSAAPLSKERGKFYITSGTKLRDTVHRICYKKNTERFTTDCIKYAKSNPTVIKSTIR